MKNLNEKELIKKLLDKVNINDHESIDFLRDSGLVESHAYTAYTYEDRYGNYIGNSEQDDSDDLLDKILDDQNLDEFMDEFIPKYVDDEDLETYEDEGLSKAEIALKVLEKD